MKSAIVSAAVLGDEQAFGGGQRRNGQGRPSGMHYDDKENDDGLKKDDDEARDVEI